MKNFIDRLKKLDWLNYFLELLIVFIGVYLAFYFSQLAESNKARKQEVIYLKNILEDLNDDKESSINIIEDITWELNTIKNFSKLMKAKKSNLLDSLAIPLARFSGITFYHPDVPTYQTLLDNGEVLKITNLELRNQLDSYYAYLPTLKIRFKDVGDVKKQKLVPYLSENYNFWDKKIINADAFRNEQLLNILFELYDKSFRKRNTYKKILKRVTKLQELVKNELNSKQ